MKFKSAKKLAIEQLDELYKNALEDIGEEQAMIFNAHKMMADDIDYSNSVINVITDDNANAEYAVWFTSREFEREFENMDTEYMQQRASDIRDVSRRIINCMSNLDVENFESFLSIHGQKKSFPQLLKISGLIGFLFFLFFL